MFRTPSKTDQAKDAVAAGAEKVTDGAQVAADKAAELKVKAGEAATATAAGAVVAKEKAADAAEVARETAETVKEYAQEAAETLAPKVEHARETFVDDVLPKVASALAAIAAGAAAARESAAEAADRAPDAYAVLKGDAVAKKGGKGKWILLLGALAAGAAVMAWRKSNERPDPWATAGSYTPPKPVSEKVSDLAAAAKEKATEVKDAAVEKAGELKDKATDAKNSGRPRPPRPRTPRRRQGCRGQGHRRRRGRRGGGHGRRRRRPRPNAAEGAADDTAIPSISETSEGADLSTPHLDTAVDRQGLTAPAPRTHDAGCPDRAAGVGVCGARLVARVGVRSQNRSGQAVAEREQRVVVAGDVLGVGAHLVHRARQVERQPPARRDAAR